MASQYPSALRIRRTSYEYENTFSFDISLHNMIILDHVSNVYSSWRLVTCSDNKNSFIEGDCLCIYETPIS